MISGKELKALREKKGLTQEDVGKAIGLSKQTVGKYETGRLQELSSKKIEIMAAMYGVSPAYIMGWEEKKPTPEYVELYEQLSQNDKAAITAVMRSIATRTNSEAI